jgi:sensor histidine kinase YesM
MYKYMYMNKGYTDMHIWKCMNEYSYIYRLLFVLGQGALCTLVYTEKLSDLSKKTVDEVAELAKKNKIISEGRYIYIFVNMYMYICISMYLYVYILVYISLFMYMNTFLYLYIYLYIYLYKKNKIISEGKYILSYMYIYMYAYQCIYI